MGSLARKPLLPEFENSVFEGYAVNYVEKNFWRIQTIFGDMEDAVSEAKVVYYWCRERYGGTVNNLKHFMALYKMVMRSWFNDWSNWDTRERRIMEASVKEPTCEPEANLTTLLSEASSELKQVIQLIINAPSEILEVFRSDKRTDAEAFFTQAVELSGFQQDKVPVLRKELETLLS